MSDNQYKLVQYCIETQQYFTIKIHNCYCLFHRNLVQHSNNHKLELGNYSILNFIRLYLCFVLELSPLIIKKIFDSKPLSAIDVKSSCHVDPSLYDMIIFADKSITYTRTQLSLENNKDKLTVKESVQKKKKQRKLPYYVDADIELLKCCGISQSDIDVFKNKLNDKKLDLFHLNKYDHIIEKIINHTDITTTLK